MKERLILIALTSSLGSQAQSNAAVTSGSIGKCAVWDYPSTLYNNGSATQSVNSGVTVTVDQNRNIGILVLNGSGAMDLSGANGITMSGSGGEITCRWNITSGGSYRVTNNEGVFSNNSRGESSISLDNGVFFTAPYAGAYRWVKGSGWGALMSGSFLSGSFGIRIQGNDYYEPVYYENQAHPLGTCGNPAGAQSGPVWTNSRMVTMGAGQKLSYAASTTYRLTGACADTKLDFDQGNSTLFYEN